MKLVRLRWGGIFGGGQGGEERRMGCFVSYAWYRFPRKAESATFCFFEKRSGSEKTYKESLRVEN